MNPSEYRHGKVEVQKARFVSEEKATAWARRFDYARGLIGLKPLAVKQDGEDWIVYDPEKEFLCLY